MVKDNLFEVSRDILFNTDTGLRKVNKELRFTDFVGWPAKWGANVAWLQRYSHQSAALEETILASREKSLELPEHERIIVSASLGLSHADVAANAAMWSNAYERLRLIDGELEAIKDDPISVLLGSRHDALLIKILEGLSDYATSRDLSSTLLDKLTHGSFEEVAERNLEFNYGDELGNQHPLFAQEHMEITKSEMFGLSTYAAFNYWGLSVLTQSSDDIPFARDQALTLCRSHGPAEPAGMFDSRRILVWFDLVEKLPQEEIQEVLVALQVGFAAEQRRFQETTALHDRAVAAFPNADTGISERTKQLGDQVKASLINAQQNWMRATYLAASAAAGIAGDLEQATDDYLRAVDGLGSPEDWPEVLVLLASGAQIRVQRSRGSGKGETYDVFRLGLTKAMAQSSWASTAGAMWPLRDVLKGLEYHTALTIGNDVPKAVSRISAIDDLLRGSMPEMPMSLAARLHGKRDIQGIAEIISTTNIVERIMKELQLHPEDVAIMPVGDARELAFLLFDSSSETPTVVPAKSAPIIKTHTRHQQAIWEAREATNSYLETAEKKLKEAAMAAFDALPGEVKSVLTKATALHVVPGSAVTENGFILGNPELLHNESSFIGENVIISRSSSLRSLAVCLSGSTSTSSGDSAMILASYPSGDYSLKWAHEELDLVADQLSVIGLTMSHYDWAGMSRELLEQNLPNTRVLHIAGHGRSNDLGEWLETPDGFIIAPDEIRKWATVAPPLIYMNTCELARQFLLGTIMKAGFASAFAHLGSRAFISNLGRIPDQDASRLATSFYQNAIKESVGEALRLARSNADVPASSAGCCVLYGDPTVRISKPFGGAKAAGIAELIANVSKAICSDGGLEDYEDLSKGDYYTVREDVRATIELVRSMRAGDKPRSDTAGLMEVLTDPLLRAIVLLELSKQSYESVREGSADLDATWNLVLKAASSVDALIPAQREILPHADFLRELANELLTA